MMITANTSTNHYQKLIEILGKEYVRAKIESPYDFIQIATEGVNANVIKNFRLYFNIPRQSTANMLNISEPTLYRWIKANKNLERNFSVQLFELADLFLYGSEVFQNKDNFLKWLTLSNTSLGGYEPQALIEIPGGVAKVRDILGRIQYGIYS